ASLPAGSTRITWTRARRFDACVTPAGQAIDALSSALPPGTANLTRPKVDLVPAQFVKRPPRTSDSVTTACLITAPGAKARPYAVTCCAVGAVLVTVTAHDASEPGLPVKFSWLADSWSAGPADPAPGSQEASSTARRLFSRPAPCSMA